MKLHTIEIVSKNEALPQPDEVLSLRPFINYLKQAKEHAGPHKQKVLSLVLIKCQEQVGAREDIPLEDINKFGDLLQLVYLLTSPILEEEHHHYWALSMPVSPTVFYSTDVFFNTVADEATLSLRENRAMLSQEELNKNHIEYCYAMVLQQCYQVSTGLHQKLLYPFEDPADGLLRFFRINFDYRFIKVSPKGELPAWEHARQPVSKDELIAELKERLPLDQFRFEGISIMTVTDVTPEYAVEMLKKTLIARPATFAPDQTPEVIKALQTLVKSNYIEFGLFPLLKVNNRYIFNERTCSNSILLQMFDRQGLEKEVYNFMGEDYMQNPKPFFLEDIPQSTLTNFACVDALTNAMVSSYAVIPIFFNNRLSGVLEMYARKKGVLKESMLSALEPALPFVAQLFQKTIDEFENSIQLVIKNNFTAVQPAVEWKFNEAAWHYLRDKQPGDPSAEIENIIFEKVYPLYGAVDLRNSTVERNEALRKDLKIQFDILLDVLEDLKQKTAFQLLDEKIFLCQKWLTKITSPEGFAQENRLTEFLEAEIVPFLNDLIKGNADLKQIAARYFGAIDERRGAANKNRRQLETSMNLVITAIDQYMDLLKEEMQQAYPCYFEKFKTDGVEYDLYIGQSLSPHKPFSKIFLNNLRLTQLKGMATIAKHTHAMLPQMPTPIATTQLIFIHAQTIDIRFRKDEKRFDVEGAYNIRYHIVKKRIDKVLIKGTRERLTMPNKIALVYYGEKQAEEFAGYIRYLQAQNILMDDLEYLELEALQGVSGLKAMRVGVVLD